MTAQVEIGGADPRHRPMGAEMLAGLDLLLRMVFYTEDDLLPAGKANARRALSDAEVISLLAPGRSWGSRRIDGSEGPPASSS